MVCSCNLHYRLHVTLLMSQSVCFGQNYKRQQQNTTDESAVDLTAPECCLLRWEGFRGLRMWWWSESLRWQIEPVFQRCCKWTQVRFQRGTRWDVAEESTACLLVMPEIRGMSIWTQLLILPHSERDHKRATLRWRNGTLEWLDSQS